MGRDANFVNLFGHAAYCAGQVDAALGVRLSTVAVDRACLRDRTIVKILNSWGSPLEKFLAGVSEAEEIIGLGGLHEKPTGSVRDAAEDYMRLSEEKQSALCAMVADPIIRWSMLQKLTDNVARPSEVSAPDPGYQVGINAFEKLLGLHCLIGGEATETAVCTFGAIAESLIEAAMPKSTQEPPALSKR